MERIFSSTNDESWDDFTTPREAMEALDDNDNLDVGEFIYTGIKRYPSASNYITDADRILELYDENVYENNGEYADDNTGSDGVTDEAKKELTDFLNQWADKHLSITFWEIQYIENIQITQAMLDAYHAGTEILLPEFVHKDV
ncbi:hypothetical protein F965_00048 [Acinetobacter schindleri NIPH 900]|uniref:Uncharacterized protein n=1 Tax=Acinetobacter schindleri NIPH 900 TaxID=1217675 RepID=N8WRH5_9GAMM|nr:hypothetical protein [Acinetobacter schindleri]ENV14702.1 hypothetical protein F965_00048 [Acinetobacter schindleri NIPH 900]